MRRPLASTVRQPSVAAGATHASTVIPDARLSGPASRIRTRSSTPSNCIADPYRPSTRAAPPISLPVWPKAEASPTTVPASASSKP